MDFFEKIAELVNKAKLPVRHRARSALTHIARAHTIKEIDKEMALFRLITAEEEAATAIFLALKAKRYANADKLKYFEHLHKNSVIPFLRSLQMVFTELNIERLKPAIQVVKRDGKEIVNIRFLNPFEETPTGYITMEPPLEFEMKDDQGKFIDLSVIHKKMAEEKNHKSVIAMLEEKANFRNRLLYATEVGIPTIKGSIDKEFKKREGQILLLLSIYLMIDPYKERQSFVQACLNEFVAMVQRVPKPNPKTDVIS